MSIQYFDVNYGETKPLTQEKFDRLEEARKRSGAFHALVTKLVTMSEPQLREILRFATSLEGRKTP